MQRIFFTLVAFISLINLNAFFYRVVFLIYGYFVAPPSSRAPTEYIPNTPDSTLAPSAKSPSASPSPTPRLDSQTSVVEKTPSSDPMIKVMLRKHGGHEACKPFTIEPKQMVSVWLQIF